jgi:hypothetical protein
MPRRSRDSAIDSQAASIARAAWEVPESRYSVQFRARIPKDLAEEMAIQSPTARGDRWADGVKAERSLPLLLKAVEQLCPLESPSWIVDSHGVTVVWGEWSATADTQVAAVLLLLEAVLGG